MQDLSDMQQITLNAEAGSVSRELIRRGVRDTTRVHVVVEIVDGIDDQPPEELAQAGGAFDWLGDEPNIYSDADLRPLPT